MSALKLMDTRNNWVLTSEKNKVSTVGVTLLDVGFKWVQLFDEFTRHHYCFEPAENAKSQSLRCKETAYDGRLSQNAKTKASCPTTHVSILMCELE